MPPTNLTLITLGRGDLSPQALRAVAACELVVGSKAEVSAARHLMPPTVISRVAPAAPESLAAEAAASEQRVTVLVDPRDVDAVAAALARHVPDVPLTVLA